MGRAGRASGSLLCSEPCMAVRKICRHCSCCKNRAVTSLGIKKESCNPWLFGKGMDQVPQAWQAARAERSITYTTLQPPLAAADLQTI